MTTDSADSTSGVTSAVPVSRRAVIGAGLIGAGLGASALAACSRPAIAAPAFIRAATPPSPADWRSLDRAITGDVLLPGSTAYAGAKQLFNPRFDTAHPAAVVRVANAHDVSTALRFARRHRVALTPRSGGHSYVGDSTGTGQMVIDVRHLRSVRYSPATGIAGVGAGTNLYAVHAALAAHDRTIPTGSCPTVGAAGLTLGGGLGADSRAHGLTSDRLRSVTLVLADGSVVTADATRSPDLYWTARGGGGGNFGVVTELAYATHPSGAMGLFLLTFPAASAVRVLTGWARWMASASRSTWATVHVDANAATESACASWASAAPEPRRTKLRTSPQPWVRSRRSGSC